MNAILTDQDHTFVPIMGSALMVESSITAKIQVRCANEEELEALMAHLTSINLSDLLKKPPSKKEDPPKPKTQLEEETIKKNEFDNPIKYLQL